MEKVNTVSNDECVAGLHRLIAVVADILYSLKGDLGSFLVQAQEPTPSNIEARYDLHIKENMPAALAKLEGNSAEAKRLIKGSDNPDAVKIKWLKCIALYEDAFRSIESRQIHSHPETYIDAAENVLKVVNSFQKLTDCFSVNVELITVNQDLNTGLRHLQTVERAFAKAFRLAQEFGFVTKLTREEKTELRNQLVRLPRALK